MGAQWNLVYSRRHMLLRVISATASHENDYKFGNEQPNQIISDRLDAYHIFSEVKKNDLKNKTITKR